MLNYEKRNPFGRVEIGEGEVFPEWYYGLAYRDFVKHTAVLYPIPLNWIVRWGRNLLHFLAVPQFEDYVEEEKLEAYDVGYEDGRKFERNQRAWRATEEVDKFLEEVISDDGE